MGDNTNETRNPNEPEEPEELEESDESDEFDEFDESEESDESNAMCSAEGPTVSDVATPMVELAAFEMVLAEVVGSDAALCPNAALSDANGFGTAVAGAVVAEPASARAVIPRLALAPVFRAILGPMPD